MEKGTIIYKQFHKDTPLDKTEPKNMSGLQWFALEENYGSSYGDIHKKYIFKIKPNLLDIGDGNVRELIEEIIYPFNDKILFYSDPNEQYSGGESNRKYHNLVKTYFENEYDGTIINEKYLKSSNKYSEEELDGPSEIVLWRDFDKLLEELNPLKKRKTKKRKNKKRKSLKNKKTKTQSLQKETSI